MTTTTTIKTTPTPTKAKTTAKTPTPTPTPTKTATKTATTTNPPVLPPGVIPTPRGYQHAAIAAITAAMDSKRRARNYLPGCSAGQVWTTARDSARTVSSGATTDFAVPVIADLITGSFFANGVAVCHATITPRDRDYLAAGWGINCPSLSGFSLSMSDGSPVLDESGSPTKIYLLTDALSALGTYVTRLMRDKPRRRAFSTVEAFRAAVEAWEEETQGRIAGVADREETCTRLTNQCRAAVDDKIRRSLAQRLKRVINRGRKIRSTGEAFHRMRSADRDETLARVAGLDSGLLSSMTAADLVASTLTA